MISPFLFVWGDPFCLQIVVLFDFFQSVDDSDDMQRDTHTRNDIQIDHDHQVLGIYSQHLTTSCPILERPFRVQDAQAYQKALGTAKSSDELSLAVRLFD